MNKILRILVLPVQLIWELPQILLGFLLFTIMKFRQRFVRIVREKHHFFIETPNMGVSLGWFIFWTPRANRFIYLKNDCRMHEYGHARQSARLGPLYLLVVGIPSLARVFYRWWFYKKYHQSWGNYYNGFPEDWADSLGGIINPKRSDFYEGFL
jgi:hypothetical protein